MIGSPDWQDGECCFRCRTQFTLVARKHHCRNCGNIFCAKCSSQQIPLPKLNIDKNVRVCDTCYEKITSKSAEVLTSSDKDKEQTRSKTTATSSSKSATNASAPSEQELKEEEDLQLAMALSVSETTPANIHFPDYRHLEEPVPSTVQAPSKPTTVGTNDVTQSTTSNTRDLEVFRYVGEIQSTLEIFNNRLESCKLRGRPVANDAAIQTLFLKLNSEFQPKIMEFNKIYEEERAHYERLQDKLSQISDARAALDDLRQEHREKVRQEAAEAERLRQSQLASKLEAMRQKKSQMMQYQRELASQRIREQELMLQRYQQPPTSITTTSQAYLVPPTVAGAHYMASNQASFDPLPHQHQHPPISVASTGHVCQVPSAVAGTHYVASNPSQQWPQQTPTSVAATSQVYQVPTAVAGTHYMASDQASFDPLQQQHQLHDPSEEDTPLISFDD